MLLLLTCALTCHCDDDDNIIGGSGPYVLEFSWLSDFGVAHGGEPIAWALVRSSDGAILLSGNGTVRRENPAFYVNTGPVMEAGEDYALHYWIDSNINGGTLGVCDTEDIDRQWKKEFLSVSDQINYLEVLVVGLVEYVCDTFTP